MVKMVDIAKHAGVSVSTVSRVINHPQLVDVEKRHAVQAIIDKLGFRPNALAQGLVSQSSKTIGVVINQFSSTYYGRMLDGVEGALSAMRYKTIAESSRETAKGELDAVASLKDRQCDGIILHSDSLSDDQLCVLMEEHADLVLMNRPLEGFEDRCVYVDNVQIGHMAADYLLAANHRDIAVVTGPMEFFECRHRLDGFSQALAAHGAPLDPDMIWQSDFTGEGGQAVMRQILDVKRDVSAIFFMNDEMAAGAIDLCLNNDISVPGDYSILGCDDLDLAAYMHPKLSTIRQPLKELGHAAGVLAHALAKKHGTANLDRILKTEVVERASVAPV